jgi:acetate kinase
MAIAEPALLTLNGGSSSLKAACFTFKRPPQRRWSGAVQRIGVSAATLSVRDSAGASRRSDVEAADHEQALQHLLDALSADALSADCDPDRLCAVGHRIVHGGPLYHRSQRVTPEMLAELHRISPYDPEHLPAELALVEAVARQRPNLPQIACFDTAFHHDLPTTARLLPIPRRYADAGVRRYGFHGLSYAYLMQELGRLAGADAAQGRVILAHLGNGASLAAVRAGRCLDTTMAFTPTAGLPMSTRSGDLDPGLFAYLTRSHGLSVEQFHDMVNHHSGLLGISEISSDMRDLLDQEMHDPRAAEAVAIFCYQVRKWIGAYAAALGGLDTLVFSAGIGAHQPVIRARICAGLEFLGVRVDEQANAANAPVISAPGPVSMRVIPTDEERMIAEEVMNVLGSGNP